MVNIHIYIRNLTTFKSYEKIAKTGINGIHKPDIGILDGCAAATSSGSVEHSVFSAHLRVRKIGS